MLERIPRFPARQRSLHQHAPADFRARPALHHVPAERVAQRHLAGGGQRLRQPDLPGQELPIAAEHRDQRNRRIHQLLDQPGDPVESFVRPGADPEPPDRSQACRIAKNAPWRPADPVFLQHRRRPLAGKAVSLPVRTPPDTAPNSPDAVSLASF